MRQREDVREWKTKKLMSEMSRADGDFWRWQADGLRPGYDCEAYADELAHELRNRGYDYD